MFGQLIVTAFDKPDVTTVYLKIYVGVREDIVVYLHFYLQKCSSQR